ncbi:hypothetical protein G6F32_016454 [Rhizopus arrhizus]|nr:hypothetical protein G6F32_016454 [Rhizopus arrhizus]
MGPGPEAGGAVQLCRLRPPFRRIVGYVGTTADGAGRRGMANAHAGHPRVLGRHGRHRLRAPPELHRGRRTAAARHPGHRQPRPGAARRYPRPRALFVSGRSRTLGART